MGILFLAHCLRFDPVSRKPGRCLVCRGALPRGSIAGSCRSRCRVRVLRLRQRFAATLGFLATTEPVSPWEVSLSDEALRAAHLSMRFGRHAACRVRLPEYLGDAFTNAVADVGIGDGIALDLPAPSGLTNDADEPGERHVTGDQRDVASASQMDGSVDVPVHTQDAGDGSSPTRTPPVVSGTPPSSAPARSDVDDRVHEHRSALPPEPVRDPDDGTPAQPMAAPEFVSPTLPPPPSAAELRAVLELYAGDVDDAGPAAPLASAQAPSGTTALPPVGTDVRDGVRDDLARTDRGAGPLERERAAPDLPGADAPPPPSAAELRAVLELYAGDADDAGPAAPLASAQAPSGTTALPPVGTDVRDGVRDDLARTDRGAGPLERERAAPDLPGADAPPPPSAAELRAVLELYAGDADDAGPAAPLASAQAPSGTMALPPVGTDVRDGVHDDLACTDDDSGAPARERAAPDLPGADPPPPPSSADLRAVLDLYAGDADDDVPSAPHSPSGTSASPSVDTDVREGLDDRSEGSDDDTGPPERERAAPDLPGADAPPLSAPLVELGHLLAPTGDRLTDGAVDKLARAITTPTKEFVQQHRALSSGIHVRRAAPRPDVAFAHAGEPTLPPPYPPTEVLANRERRELGLEDFRDPKAVDVAGSSDPPVSSDGVAVAGAQDVVDDCPADSAPSDAGDTAAELPASAEDVLNPPDRSPK